MRVILILVLLSSCSTQRKSEIYGAISGGLICGVLGASLGKELSPNIESEGVNKLIGGASGASLCSTGGFFLGRALYKSDPRNQEMKPIEIKAIGNTSKQEMLNVGLNEVDFNDLKKMPNEALETPFIKTLPKELKAKIQKQKIIKYKIEPQTIKTKDGRTLYFSGGEAIEHKYQSQ